MTAGSVNPEVGHGGHNPWDRAFFRAPAPPVAKKPVLPRPWPLKSEKNYRRRT